MSQLSLYVLAVFRLITLLNFDVVNASPTAVEAHQLVEPTCNPPCTALERCNPITRRCEDVIPNCPIGLPCGLKCCDSNQICLDRVCVPDRPVAITLIQTVTTSQIVTVPGPTTTIPGPTTTIPGPTITIPGPTTTITGPTTTVTAPCDTDNCKPPITYTVTHDRTITTTTTKTVTTTATTTKITTVTVTIPGAEPHVTCEPTTYRCKNTCCPINQHCKITGQEGQCVSCPPGWKWCGHECRVVCACEHGVCPP